MQGKVATNGCSGVASPKFLGGQKICGPQNFGFSASNSIIVSQSTK